MLRLAAVFALSLSLTLVGCPSESAGTCARTEPAATGPGDARALFPASVGDLWAYRVDEGGVIGRARVEVAGAATVDGRSGLRFTDTGMGPSPRAPSAAVVAVEPGGVTALARGDLDALAPGLGALVGRHLLLRFPVAAGDTFTSFECRGLRAGSLDDDDRVDPIDARALVTVGPEAEVATPAGPRLAVRIDTRLEVAVHSSQLGTIAMVDELQDWYAPGLGLVRSSERLQSPGLPDALVTREVYAWSVGGAEVGPVTRPLTLATGALTPGALASEGWQVWRATAPAGAPLLVGMLGQGQPLGLGGAGAAGIVPWDCRVPAGVQAAMCQIPAGAGQVELEVDAGVLAPSEAGYALLAAPRPVVAAPADESLAFARGEVVVGQVGTRGTSGYTVTGLTPGTPVTVALFGVDGAANLRPAPGTPPSASDGCWLEAGSVVPAAWQCALVPSGDTAAFTVEAGALERVGASYLLAVW